MPATTHPSPEFAATLGRERMLVDQGVQIIVDGLQDSMAGQPPEVQQAVGSCITALENGGKHIRGMLTVTGSRMHGETDEHMISRAAGAVEAVHTSLLVQDDVHDNSAQRRGQPAAHVAMARYLTERGAPDDADQRGRDTAQTGALIMKDHALATFAQLAVPAERRIVAIHTLATHLVQTGYGQLRDISPVNYDRLDPQAILEMYRLKTGLYTFAMPLKIGAALAGAPAPELPHFDPFSLNAGIAFQLRDDVIGTFNDAETTGKPPNSDIVEGKATWLLARALEVASLAQKHALLAALGNAALTDAAFDDCKTILRETGALEKTHQLIADHTEMALRALDQAPPHWRTPQLDFLRSLVHYNAQRQS